MNILSYITSCICLIFLLNICPKSLLIASKYMLHVFKMPGRHADILRNNAQKVHDSATTCYEPASKLLLLDAKQNCPTGS